MAENEKIKTALTRAMSLCAGNEHCSSEMHTRLESWGLNSEDAGRIIDSLVKENFINDKRYAEAFVSDKFRHNKWGRVKIAALLRARRLPPELIASALETLIEDHYRQTLREILASHRRVTRAKSPFEMKGKLLRFGLSRGFESHILYDILNETEEE